MRRLTEGTRRGGGEDGIALILVCVSLVVVLAMAAFVVDIGALVQEKRQLQNGADAAALSVAHSCALGEAACASPTSSALTIASANANDNASNVDAATVDTAKHLVHVSTSTRSASGGTLVPFQFAKAITGQSGATVHATATATWGPPASLKTLPLTLSVCVFNGVSFGTPTVVYFHDTAKAPGCPDGPAGKDIPGGFGWLTPTSGCSVTLPVGTSVSLGSSGSSIPNPCDVSTLLGTTVLMPVFTDVNGTGSKATYTVGGYGAFVVTGYRFPSKSAGSPVPCKSPDTCIGGAFTKFVTDPGTIGGTDFGVETVKLVS